MIRFFGSHEEYDPLPRENRNTELNGHTLDLGGHLIHTVSSGIQPAFCIKPSRHNDFCCNQTAKGFTQTL
jgi:hypothetical protein